MSKKTRTLKKGGGFLYRADCPTCEHVIEVHADDVGIIVMEECDHFRRAWRVAADGRVRAEFEVPETAEVGHAA